MVGRKLRQVTDYPGSNRKKPFLHVTCRHVLLKFDRIRGRGDERGESTQRDDDRVQAKSNTTFAPRSCSLLFTYETEQVST